MTRFGKVMAVFMVTCLSFYALWFFGVLPKENIKELASPAMESLNQLASWLQVKARLLANIIIQKFFRRGGGPQRLDHLRGELSYSQKKL